MNSKLITLIVFKICREFLSRLELIKNFIISKMTYAKMSAATVNLSQFRRTTIFDSLVSKEIHDQGEMFKNIS